MTLQTMNVASVTPRGGATGTNITIVGTGFGPPTGRVVFDPKGDQGGPKDATIASWADTLITLAVPSGLTPNGTILLELISANGLEFTTVPFWLPAASPGPGTDGLDYQYPALEEGPQQNADNPRSIQAADVNRLIDRIRAAAALGTGDMLRSVYDPAHHGYVDKAVLALTLDDSGTPRDLNYIRGLIAAVSFTPRDETFAVANNGDTDFVLAHVPATSTILVFVNGVGYDTTRWSLIAPQTIRWLDVGFTLDTQDKVSVLYF